MISRWAVIDEKTQEVKSVIKWDGETPFKQRPGLYMIQSDTACPGDIYVPKKKIFTKQEKNEQVAVVVD
jgi:hypothetical protein